MAAGWMKSLQCKSRAVEDVFQPHPKQLLTSTSCRNSFQNLKDVVDKPKPKPKPNKADPFPPRVKRSDSVRPRPEPPLSNRVKRTVSAPLPKGSKLGSDDPFFPSVTELQVGHPSRNVVEIIFHTRWGPKGFSGRVEMVFKIQNLARNVAQFEEYRSMIKSRAGPGIGSGRCVADGNEMMRFHCPGPTTNSGGSLMGGCDNLKGGGGKASICTYSGSGAAHESAGGGYGMRTMVVCRVIAGRVSKRVGLGNDSVGGDCDSVSGENGELLVFDSRAVLPCFLVIYKL